MALVLESGEIICNRHDRKRGMETPEYICHMRICGANLHDSGIVIIGGSRYLSGRYIPGLTEGGAIIETMVYRNYSEPVCCAECGQPQPHLYLEDIFFDPDAVTLEEEQQFEPGEITGEAAERYARLVLNL